MEETVPIRGEKIWPSTIIMRYLNRAKGSINMNSMGEVRDPAAILQDEFLGEHTEEIMCNFLKPKKQEDSVKDILAQENLCMNLDAL